MDETSQPRHPVIGSEIWTADEEYLGRAEGVLGDYFRVVDDEGRELWFNLSTLEAASDGRATTEFEAADLGTYTAPAPDDYQESQYLEKPLSPEEDEQRELMLRQMVEQRKQLREEETPSPEATETVGEPVEEELAHRRRGEGGHSHRE